MFQFLIGRLLTMVTPATTSVKLRFNSL